MIVILVANTVLLFLIAERLKPITGSAFFEYNIFKMIKNFMLRQKLVIGDYYAHAAYRDIDDFMLEDKIDEVVIVRNFGKRYVEVEVIEERNKNYGATQLPQGYTLSQNQSQNPNKKYLKLGHFFEYYRKYNGNSPGIKKMNFGKEMEKL